VNRRKPILLWPYETPVPTGDTVAPSLLRVPLSDVLWSAIERRIEKYEQQQQQQQQQSGKVNGVTEDD